MSHNLIEFDHTRMNTECGTPLNCQRCICSLCFVSTVINIIYNDAYLTVKGLFVLFEYFLSPDVVELISKLCKTINGCIHTNFDSHLD